MNMSPFFVLVSWFLPCFLAASTGIEIGAPFLLTNLLRLEVAVNNMTWKLASVETSQVATRKELASTRDELQSTKTELASTSNKLQSTKTELASTRDELRSTKTELRSTKKILNDKVSSLEYVTTSGAAPYIRWGRKDCPPGRQVIYSGVAAGGSYNHKAGPANTLCLPNDPEYGNHTTNYHSRSYIYGSEYETSNQLTGFNHLQDHDVPCTMCRTKQRRNTVMIPARKSCPKDWALEYTGYLMGGAYTHAASEYLCIDGKAQSLEKGHTSQNGHLLYLVEGACGPLPCPPYKQYWELTCVVCSK